MTHDPDAVAAQEHATWQFAAEAYADFIGPITAGSGQVPILQEIAGITDADTVLELGSGSGDVAVQLAAIARQVTGIDFSENMVAVSKSRFPDIGFHVADAEKVPFEDESFDVVVSNYTAHHFARPDVVFTEALRVLKAGGRLAVIMPIQSEQPGWLAFMSSVMEEIPPEDVPGGPLVNITEPGELTPWIEKAGFSNVNGEKRVKPLRLGSLDVILNGGWEFMGLAERPQDMQERIRANTVERAEPYRQADGSYEFPDRVLVASAVKPG